jgi:selenocysteine lyase/cysteine desulfurase
VRPTIQKDIVEAIEEKIDKDTYLIVCTAVSNVTGEELPIRKIGELAKKHGLLFLVDGAQGAGHIPLSLKKDNISMLAMASHKGLYGIMGSGVLCFSDEVDIAPLTFGGTGTDSFMKDMPSSYPERLEAGTLNLPAIASLKEGINYISTNLNHFSEQLEKTTEKIISRLLEIERVKVYSKANKSGIISFLIDGMDSVMVADKLNSEYDIAVRGGFHCAPLTHKYLNTLDTGLVRASLAVQNSAHEISRFLEAVTKIAKG